MDSKKKIIGEKVKNMYVNGGLKESFLARIRWKSIDDLITAKNKAWKWYQIVEKNNFKTS